MSIDRSFVWDKVIEHLHAVAPKLLDSGDEFVEGLTMLILWIVKEALDREQQRAALVLDRVVETAVEYTIKQQFQRTQLVCEN